MLKDNYYISFVVASRNDNHGGNMKQKNKFFVERLMHQINKFKLNSEVIVVDWNPPKKSKNFKNEFNLNKYNKNLKIITVPNKIHNKFKNSKKLKFFQMIAKNVGIRHAKGKFILCTNIDIIFSDSIFSYFKKKELKNNVIYRCDRHDIDFDNYENIKINDNNLLKLTNAIHKKNFSLDLLTNKKYYVNVTLRKIYEDLKLKQKLLIKRFFSSKKIKNISIANLIPNIILFCQFLIRYFELIVLEYRRKQFQFSEEIKKLFEKKLHTNACGDFTLASRHIWNNISAYYEFEGYSWHIDSIFMWKAFYNNYKFSELKHEIFHMNHDIGSGYNFNNNKLFNNLKKKKISYISNNQFNGKIKKNLKINKNLYANNNWGLKNETESIYFN